MALTLNTPKGIRDQFQLSPKITDDRIALALLGARRRMREWVGEGYMDALNPNTPNDEQADHLYQAEAFLVMNGISLPDGMALPKARSEYLAEAEKWAAPYRVDVVRDEDFETAPERKGAQFAGVKE